MAVDETSLPYVMPTSVPRVTADGKPTTHLINWEEATRNWYFTNAVATDKRITEVKSDTDDAHARITEETNARTTADSALAEQITTVEATVGNVTANGQIYFAAAATPAGSLAAYGLYLTAGNAFTGFEAIAMSDGTSAIGFTASKFVFTDSGTAKQVFTYTGGKFVLTGDVSINGNLVVNGSIVADKIQNDAISRIGTGQSASAGGSATANVDAKDGDRILVTVTYSPNGMTTETVTSATGTIRLNGSTSTQKTMRVQKFVGAVEADFAGETFDTFPYFETATRQFLFVAPSTGTQTITATGVPDTNVFISALALSK